MKELHNMPNTHAVLAGRMAKIIERYGLTDLGFYLAPYAKTGEFSSYIYLNDQPEKVIEPHFLEMGMDISLIPQLGDNDIKILYSVDNDLEPREILKEVRLKSILDPLTPNAKKYFETIFQDTKVKPEYVEVKFYESMPRLFFSSDFDLKWLRS